MKRKLTLKQHKLYSVAKEQSSRNLVHKSTFCFNGERDLLLRRKDNEWNETNDGEAHALVFWEGGTAFMEMVCHPFSILLWSVTSGHGHTRCVVECLM